MFLPEDIIPATVSYFVDQTEDTAVALVVEQESAVPVLEDPQVDPQLAEAEPEQPEVTDIKLTPPVEETPQLEIIAETNNAPEIETPAALEPEVPEPADSVPAPQLADTEQPAPVIPELVTGPC